MRKTVVVTVVLALCGTAFVTTAWSAAPTSTSAPAAPEMEVYTKDNPPPAPKLEELPLKESITRYGITWTFDKPARVGQFVNGDWYVVGPVTVTAIDPKPLFGDEVKNPIDLERNNKALGGKYARNGSMVNRGTGGLDSRSRLYKPEVFARPPISLKPGDALVSSISLPKFVGNSTSIDTVSVLTCMKEPAPADAFRPGYMDREQTIFLARNLRRELLPRLATPKGEKGEQIKTPDIKDVQRRLDRPWMEMCFGYMEDQTSYQYDGYGRAVDQAIANASFQLCLDLRPQEKELLLRNLVQYGIDLYGDLKGGWGGWPALGGWGSGRKWPIVFSGILQGDDRMAFVKRTFPQAKFQEDLMTRYDDCWTGAGVVYCGHTGWFDARPQGRPLGWGPYENVHPTRWTGWIGTSYRTNMTSSTWIGSALLIRIFRAEKEWGHDAFLDYCDRWMYEPDSGVRNPLRFSMQGCGWDPFAEAMWKTFREKLPEIPGRDTAQRPTDGWKKKRELKGPDVAVGKGRELVVNGKPMFPIMIWAEHPARIDDAVAVGANVVAEGIFEKPDNFSAFWMLNAHDPKWVQDLVAGDSRKRYAVGTNVAVATQNDGFLDALAAKGLYGIFGADARTLGHPALLGWIHVDQADVVAAKAAAMPDKELQTYSPGYRCMKAVKTMVASDDWYGPKPPIKDVPDHLLLVQPAYEWMKKMDKSRPVFLTVGEAFFKTEAEGKKDFCEGFLKNCEAVGSRMPAAQIGQSVAKLCELAPGKPVYAWIETKGVKPEEIRSAVRAAVAAGATGIGYRGFEGLKLEKPDPAVMAELKKINEQISTHAAELLADPAKADALLK